MEPTKNQQFHLILSDIAMAMSIRTLDADYQIDAASYQPGTVRDDWFKRSTDSRLSQRVIALANAGLASLSNLTGADLLDKAQRFGVPMAAALADEIAEHFVDKRNAVLVYNR